MKKLFLALEESYNPLREVRKVAQEKIEKVMREVIDLLNNKQIEKALPFFAEDADWVTPEGTFKGRGEIEEYLRWLERTTPNLVVRDAGIGVVVKGNQGLYEHVLQGTTAGQKWETPVLCIWEFKDDKIQHVRAVFDRLSIAKQAAEGWVARRLVMSVVKRAEKGLH